MKFRYWIILIINLILFVNITTELKSLTQNKFKYYLFFDFNNCSNCDNSMLKSYINDFRKIGLSDQLLIITKTTKLKEFEAFKQKLKYQFIINDTANQYFKIIKNCDLPTFVIANSEGIIIRLNEAIHINPVNIKDIARNYKCLDLFKFESYELIDSAVSVFKAFTPTINKKKDKYLVLDNFDLVIKEFDINTGKNTRLIKIDSNLNYFYIKDNLRDYKNLIANDYALAQFNFANYDYQDKIIATTSIISGFIRDTIVEIDKAKDDTLITHKRIFQKQTVLLQYINSEEYKVLDKQDSITYIQLQTYPGDLLSSINYKSKLNFSDLEQGDYYLLASLDTTDLSINKLYLKYSDIIKYYKLENFILSFGLFDKYKGDNLLYLNPWNNVFCKMKDNKLDSIRINGYLQKLYKNNKSYQFINFESKSLSYYISNLHVVDNKIIIYMASIDNDKMTPFTIIQVYDINKGFEKEIILDASKTNLYYSFMLKIENKQIYILSKDESEKWFITKIPIKEIL